MDVESFIAEIESHCYCVAHLQAFNDTVETIFHLERHGDVVFCNGAIPIEKIFDQGYSFLLRSETDRVDTFGNPIVEIRGYTVTDDQVWHHLPENLLFASLNTDEMTGEPLPPEPGVEYHSPIEDVELPHNFEERLEEIRQELNEEYECPFHELPIFDPSQIDSLDSELQEQVRRLLHTQQMIDLDEPGGRIVYGVITNMLQGIFAGHTVWGDDDEEDVKLFEGHDEDCCAEVIESFCSEAFERTLTTLGALAEDALPILLSPVPLLVPSDLPPNPEEYDQYPDTDLPADQCTLLFEHDVHPLHVQTYGDIEVYLHAAIVDREQDCISVRSIISTVREGKLDLSYVVLPAVIYGNQEVQFLGFPAEAYINCRNGDMFTSAPMREDYIIGQLFLVSEEMAGRIMTLLRTASMIDEC